jgi:squalene-hopene/tetraprenyl-beta-curcumene cyclase
MSLASMGRVHHPVAIRGANFLRASVRADGSWPIDTNLATWLTTLSVKALSDQPEALSPTQKQTIRDWLLNQQYRDIHPYTGAAPGGWAWTDLPGGVPDADDTAGALLALGALGSPNPDVINAAQNGVVWLLNLQNRDGGIPTFCRGWGALPFDRSSPELTIHAIQAWQHWREFLSAPVAHRIANATLRACEYLRKSQRGDGSWVPLWFGNESASEQENPVYGTARTLSALNALPSVGSKSMIENAAGFLKCVQLPTGGWGGDSNGPESIEETALAVEATNCPRGVRRLLTLLEMNENNAAPIGLYFARLWYFERLYPLIFATSALGRICSNQL